MKRGFTLLEMLIATAITAVVAGELVVVMMGIFRLQKERMWNVEFSDRLRIARENILFRAHESDGSASYGGLLSATNIVWAPSDDGGQVAANVQKAERGQLPAYDPAPVNLAERFSIADLDNGDEKILDAYVTNGFMFVSVKAEIIGTDGQVSNRTERIAVPVFGKQDRSGNSPWEYFLKVEEGDIQWH